MSNSQAFKTRYAQLVAAAPAWRSLSPSWRK
jgi:hypothetical protein